jgi:hypothetical protein
MLGHRDGISSPRGRVQGQRREGPVEVVWGVLVLVSGIVERRSRAVVLPVLVFVLGFGGGVVSLSLAHPAGFVDDVGS